MLENRMVLGYGYEEEPTKLTERDDPTDEDRNEWIADRDEIVPFYIPASISKILDDLWPDESSQEDE